MRPLLNLVGAVLLLVGSFLAGMAAFGGFDSPPHCTAEHTADFRYTFCFEDGTTLWSDMPPDFGYLDTMTCVYVGVNHKGAHFSRVCRPADQMILVTDKYAQEVQDPMR